MDVNRLLKIVVVVVLGGVGQLWAQADIGYLQLSGSDFGLQTIDLFNLTGVTNGCGQLYSGSPYNVCNIVDISNWQLQIDFTANVSGLSASPLIFNGAGPIGPVDASFDNPQEVGELSFDLTNPGCSPTCDAYISQIILSGTLSTDSLQLYNGSVSGPYTLDSLSSANFTTTWDVPIADYTDPNSGANVTDALFDSNDIIISNSQAPPPATPEPGSVWLVVAGAIGFGFLKRAIFARA